MEINWQNIFYITTSLVMIVVFITCLWLMRLFFVASKMIKNFTETAHKWSNIVDDIKYFKEDVKLKVSKFLLKVLDKKGKKI